jgi:hypothetical protein
MLVLALAASLPWLLASDPPRKVVYSYAVERAQTDHSDTAHGVDKMDPGGGGTFYFHNVNQHYRSPDMGGGDAKRTGTIVVEPVRQQQDGGLIVDISEDEASGGPVTCVAFADTTVVCDPNRQVSPEALALVALLGTNFVDPSKLDDARHWHLDAASGAADYTIVGKAGPILDIQEKAMRAHAGSTAKTAIDARIEYDLNRSLPTSLIESSVETDHKGSVNETVSTQTTLTLVPSP